MGKKIAVGFKNLKVHGNALFGQNVKSQYQRKWHIYLAWDIKGPIIHMYFEIWGSYDSGYEKQQSSERDAVSCVTLALSAPNQIVLFQNVMLMFNYIYFLAFRALPRTRHVEFAWWC